MAKCCATCNYYYEDYGMPCCKMYDIPEEDVKLDWCDAYEEQENDIDEYLQYLEGTNDEQ